MAAHCLPRSRTVCRVIAVKEQHLHQVFSKDSRTKARRKSFQEKGQIGAKVFKTAKKNSKMERKIACKSIFFDKILSLKVVKPSEVGIRTNLRQT
jgi:hypothetical protein